MKNRGFSIRQKVILGFLLLLVTFTIYGIYSIYTVQKNANSIKSSKEIVDPSLDAIKDLKLLISNSQKLALIWIYSPPNTPSLAEDKQALRDIHNTQYPKLKERIQSLKISWKDSLQKQSIDTIFVRTESYLKDQKAIMNQMVTYEDYKDQNKMLTMNAIVEKKIAPKEADLSKMIDKLEKQKLTEKRNLQTVMINSFLVLKNRTLIILGVLIVIGIVISLVVTNNIVNPINYINKVISLLGKGELPEDNKRKFSRDEIGEIAISVDKLITGLRSTSRFAENIGKGNYNAEYAPLSDQDVLGNALIDMRDNLAKVAEEDRRRNWSTEGLAQFGEILRKNSDDVEQLSDIIVSSLVKYVNANQGGLFIVRNDEKETVDEEDEAYLELSACYAWDKKKYLDQKVYLGDGLTGQAWQEQATIYLTDVPDDYVRITSGLGQANPDSILIVPLKTNDEVYGVVEIASFNNFEPYEVEFVENIAESIASTIKSVRSNEQTQHLLKESKMLTDQMLEQEETMRKGFEDMQASKEAMERSQALAAEKEKIFDTNTVMLYVNSFFEIIKGNDLVEEILQYTPDDINKLPLNKLFNTPYRFEELKFALQQGQPWTGIISVVNRVGDEILVKLSAGALERSEGAFLIILDDINEIKMMQN